MGPAMPATAAPEANGRSETDAAAAVAAAAAAAAAAEAEAAAELGVWGLHGESVRITVSTQPFRGKSCKRTQQRCAVPTAATALPYTYFQRRKGR